MSFDQHDPAFIEDPERVFGPIRDRQPLLHSDLYGGFWLLTRYEDVTAAALDCEALTSAVPGTTLIPSTQPRTDPLLPLGWTRRSTPGIGRSSTPCSRSRVSTPCARSSSCSRRGCSSRSCARAAGT